MSGSAPLPIATRGASVPNPFDGVAAEYDARFTDLLIGRWLRAAVWERLADTFAAGDRVLELGSGTGEDAIWLAQRGVRVTATDSSSRMLAVARRKAEAAGAADRIDFARFDFANGPSDGTERSAGSGDAMEHEEIARLRGLAPFDGAFSNFGALNCLADRTRLGETLADVLRPGARLVLVLMGPICPWEIASYLARGQPGSAFRRFRSGAPANVGEGATVKVWYPSPRHLRSELGRHFRHCATVGIGVLLPPSYLSNLVERWTPAFAVLRTIEGRLGPHFPWNQLGDHYLMILERR